VSILCTLLDARAFEPSAVDQKPAGDNAHTVAARPPGQLDRHETAHGVADKMRSLKAVVVQILFGRVDHIPDRHRTALYRRSSAMTEQCWGEHLVVAR
jgi:hypothetical protein